MGLFEKFTSKKSAYIGDHIATDEPWAFKSEPYADTGEARYANPTSGRMFLSASVAQPTPTDADKFYDVMRLVEKCPTAQRCLDIRADKVSSVPIEVERGNANTKLILTSPNPADRTLSQAVYSWVNDLTICGELWLFINKEDDSRHTLTRLRPDFIVQNPKKRRIDYVPALSWSGKPKYSFAMDAYGTNSLECWKVSSQDVETRHPGHLLRIVHHNPISSANGQGSVRSVLPSIEAWIAITKLITRVARNGHGPGVLEGADWLTDEQVAELQSTINALAAANTLNFLPGGIKYKAIGESFTQLDLVNLQSKLERHIATGLAIFPVQLGMEGESNYAAIRGAGRAFYMEWVESEAKWLVEQLEAALKAEYDPTVKLKIDSTRLPYLEDKRAEEFDSLSRSGVLTINELRALKGYGPVADGDVLSSTSKAPSASTADEPSETAKPREVGFNADTSRRPSER